MTKVVTILGTRPELIKMSRVLAEFDLHTDHFIVHTGQNFDYELNQIFFDQLDIRKPDYFLDAAEKTPAATIARTIERSDELLAEVKPDAVLVYGDTNSCMSGISAKRRKIPLFHMEAGNRCFDQRVPEEINRKIIDHISDINMVLTEHARRYLISEGLPPERTIKTGSHMREVLEYYMPMIEESAILDELGIKQQGYFLVSAHREENVDIPHKLESLMNSLYALVEKYDLPVVVSVHPRTRNRLEKLGLKSEGTRVLFLKPFGFLDYVKLQKHAFCVLSDSGTITEEASLLNLPAVTVREAHERPEGMDAGTLIMCGLSPHRVLEAVDVTVQQHKQCEKHEIVADYKARNVSSKILRIVLSYIDYVNSNVWKSPAST